MKTQLRCLMAWTLACMGAGTVQAQLACTVNSRAPLAFGAYNPLQYTAHDAQTALQLRCSGSQARLLSVRLNAGQNGSGSGRALRGPAGNLLGYQIYLNSERSQPWGDGVGGTQPLLLRAGPATDVNVPLYGRIPPRQNVPAGVYSDSVTVQLDF